MSELSQFEQEVASRILNSPALPQDDGAAEKYMEEFRSRQARFEVAATHLVTDLIRPRLEIVASQFPGASVGVADQGRCCRAVIGTSRQFPFYVRIEFCVEHDVGWRSLQIHYQLYICPLFVKVNTADRITLPLQALMPRESGATDSRFDSGQAVDRNPEHWIEERLLEFLDACQQLGGGDPSVDREMATDPVCGMRLHRRQAIQNNYRGHPWFFCSPECVAAFNAGPKKYIDFKIM